MSTASRELAGQTVVVIGGSSGIGLETARLARERGSRRDRHGARPGPAATRVGVELGARHRRVRRHRLRPAAAVLRRAARPDRPRAGHRPRPVLRAAGRVRLRTRRAATSTSTAGCRCRSLGPPSAGSARAGRCCSWAAPAAAAGARACRSSRRSRPRMPALTKNLALELAPVRVNLIAAGFVDTPLSAALLGDQLDARREQLRDDAADRARRRPGRHRGAGRAPHDEHRGHRRDVRHRRRPAARRRMISVEVSRGARPLLDQAPVDEHEQQPE